MASTFTRPLGALRKTLAVGWPPLAGVFSPNRRSGARHVLCFETLESRHLLNGDGVGVLADPLVSIPEDLQGAPGQVVVAPVNIDDADGVRAAEIHIQYDADLLLLDDDNPAAQIDAGSVWPEGTVPLARLIVEPDPNDEDPSQLVGTLEIWVFGIEPLGPGAGSLVEIGFTIAKDACEGQADPTIQTQLTLTQVILNEGAIPAQTSNGMITIVCNQAPTDIELDPKSVSEEEPIGTVVGTFTTVDPDANNSHVYSLVSGSGDTDNARFFIDGDKLKTNEVFDYETQPHGYNVRVRSTDSGGGQYDESFPITVTPLNDNRPVFTSPDSAGVPENTTAVLTLAATDADQPAQTVSFAITGGADQAQFEIVNDDELKFKTAPDYEIPGDANGDNQYLVEVTATNSGSPALGTTQTLAITVTDTNEPPVARPDEFNTDVNTELTVDSPGLLANDFDEDVGDSLEVVTVDTSETLGTVVDWNEVGGFRYQPPKDYEGDDEFQYTVEDSQGERSTATVTIHVGRNATISGFVYADTDDNGNPGKHEGVPGVLITLIGEDETWTDDDGWYEFRELRGGTYTIVERQPECMIDGGGNTLTGVVVAAAQSTVGQNFRELGLKPEYVFNRFYATSSMAIGSKEWREVCKTVVEQGEEDAGRSPSSPPAVTQQILQQGSEVVVRGTNGDDDFAFVAADTGDGQHEVTLNGETHHFDASAVSSILFDGGLGVDTATLTGSPAADQFDAVAKSASLRGAGYVAEVVRTEKTTTNAGTGAAQDKAALADSIADDVLRAEIDFARLGAYYYEYLLRDFEAITAISQHGGRDQKAVDAAIDYLLTIEGPWTEP